MKKYQIYVNGEWIDGHSNEFIDVEDPYRREVIAQVVRGDEDDINKAVEAAKNAFETWQYVSLDKRIELTKKVKEELLARKEELINTLAAELGCPKNYVRDVHTTPYIDEIDNFINLAKECFKQEEYPMAVVRREPLGVVAAITPWNFPWEQIERKVICALLAGNCVVLKPSQLTPLCAIMLTEIIDHAGFPKGVFNMVTGAGAELGKVLAEHPDVSMISFTGSTTAGRDVARRALSTIKKFTLELGGKSADILLEGADLRFGIKAALDTCIYNSGQTCNATTRLIAPRSSKDEIEQIIIEEVNKYKMMESLDDEEATYGVMASKRGYDKVVQYIKLGIEEGARMLVGEIPSETKDDLFIKPVVFVDVDNRMRIAQEEIFGPVLVVIYYDTEQEAIDIANDSIYGLGGSVFAANDEKAFEVACKIKTGSIAANTYNWDMSAPYGGYKQSGFGRECGIDGFHEYTEIKTIYVNK